MSQRTQGLLVNALVAVGVVALLHVFFVAMPSRLAERSAPGPLASPPAEDIPADTAPVAADLAGAGPAGAGPAGDGPAGDGLAGDGLAGDGPAGAGTVPEVEIVAEPVHGPSGMAPGILAAPDRN